MTTRLNPYLHFNGTARDAMEFYHSVFGGQLDIATFGQFGSPDGPDPDGVMHANLATDLGFTLMGADSPSGQEIQNTGSMTCSLSGDDAEELTAYWNKLSEGGEVQMPFEKQMWGDTFGMCVDKFGIPWMVNVAGEQQG